METKHDQILLDHIVGTLPRDIYQRRALLNAAVNLLRGEPLRTAQTLLGGIDSHLASLTSLPMPPATGGEE